MPYTATFLVPVANTYFDTKQPAKRAAARAALKGARSLAQAVDRAGLLKGAPSAATGLLALEALPKSIDVALLAVLRDAIARDVGVIMQWKPGAAAELQVWEVVEEGVSHIGVLLITPPGAELVAAKA